MKTDAKITREQMVAALNEDLAREYQAIIAYIIYSQTIKGAEFTDIAGELELHAAAGTFGCAAYCEADRLFQRNAHQQAEGSQNIRKGGGYVAIRPG